MASGEDLDLWGSAELSMGPSTSAPVRRQQKPVNKVRAVEVDMAGCSYNPDPEAHQDALGVLVATEMRKVLKRELAPISAPKLVTAHPEDELEALQVGSGSLFHLLLWHFLVIKQVINALVIGIGCLGI